MGNIKDEIAKNLLFYRKKSGLTQQELAARLGVKNTAVSNWEKGNNSIDIETLYLAASVFGVSLSDMYGKYASSDENAECSLTRSPAEQQLVNDFRSLNEEGQEKVSEYAADLVASGRYQKKNRSLSMADPA